MNNVEELKEKIWVTRKCRINAAERLLKNSKFIKLLNIYFSCYLIAINVIDITSDKYVFGILSLIASISLTISIIYLDSQQYYERANSLKKNYISLQKLYYDINEKNYEEIKKKYFELMDETENHSVYDYYKSQLDNKRQTICVSDFMKYYLREIIIYIFKLLLFLFPLFFLYKIMAQNV